ncbi:PREDICTED: protocadherin alpha-7-like [Elephantulus edwardii]|uniref:protocadherin alpha-7-like n=1 Tax=Elephantulus edwardii TaxID=28737 RepID=UPI0003F0A938|nr:PREDICTED: protocadherin alpha-7-like [Elephantulus edwardii]
MVFTPKSQLGSQYQLFSLLLLAAWEAGSGQVHYSVPEEAKHGTFVGRIAQDLGLELAELVPRLFRVASKGRGDLLEVNLQNGILFVNSRIDREELCGRSAGCSIHLEVIVDKPLQVFHVDVEVKDINDNAPVFPATQRNLFIAESRPLDSYFSLEGASDADIGANALLTYRLSPNEYFSLAKPSDGVRVKRLGLVLRKLLDREEAPELSLLLTATDGGKPELTGTVRLLITVLDANDNAPTFDRTFYTVKLLENVSNGTMVIKLNASDVDEGLNGAIIYSFSSDISPNVKSKFHIDPIIGEITVKGYIDFEESKSYEIHVEGTDKGQLPLSGQCTVLVEIEDTNDNVPDLEFKSLSLPIREDASLDTVIALISVSDPDSGASGEVACSLTPNVPFKLVSTFKNYYSLVLDGALDRESVPAYDLVVTARDGGSPALSASASVLLVLTLLLYTALRCSAPPAEGACGPGKPRLVCSSAVGSWSCSQQSRQRVCSGEGPPKTDLMAFSPSLPPCPVAADIVKNQDLNEDQDDCSNNISTHMDPGFRFGSVSVFDVQTISFSEQLHILSTMPPGLKQEFEMVFPGPGELPVRVLLLFQIIFAGWEAGSGQVHYSVLEEAKHGTFVGRIAQDLGLELAELVPRLFRVASKGRGDLLEVNLQNGILFVNSRIDREELCGRSAGCSIHLEVIVDKPLQVFHVEVEVKDINDNAPVFPATQRNLFIAESRLLDSKFPLEGASDADIGANALLTYRLSPSAYFSLDVPTNEDQVKPLGLVLQKALDREETPELSLVLTATDGGKPELTGTVQLIITVLDANDNAPVFDRTLYKVNLPENVSKGTLVIKLNASDLDEGLNGAIIYAFSGDISSDIKSKFHIDPLTGEITVIGHIDFEEHKAYKIRVEVIDKGFPPLSGHSTVLVDVVDANDNAPQLTITSLSLPVSEDAQPGTVITLISVSDRDSGANGQVTCSLTPHTPFKLVSTFKNYYSLVLDGALDRESVPAYDLVVTARDGGAPALSASASVSVEVADVNDNAPAFAQPEYTVFVKENNPPGCHIFTVSAQDADAQENALVSYSLVERRVGERSLSSYVSVHAESGKVYALQPLDHEELELLQFQVSARDAGFPPLGSNVTLQVFVLDENDNAPTLLPPASASGSGSGSGAWSAAGVAGVARSEVVARSVGAGYVVAKVRAVDADSGYNAWLSYELQAAAGGAAGPFRVGLYTGEVSTTRALDEADAPRQRLLVLVKDHGEPALTATATVLVSLVESGQALKTSSQVSAGVPGPEAALVDVNVYLIVAICAVSSLLVLTLLLYTALRCSAPAAEGACGPGKPRLVCSSAVGSWSCSQQRRQRVCSGEGPPKTDLMAFSPSLPPGPGTEDLNEQQDLNGKVPSS